MLFSVGKACPAFISRECRSDHAHRFIFVRYNPEWKRSMETPKELVILASRWILAKGTWNGKGECMEISSGELHSWRRRVGVATRTLS